MPSVDGAWKESWPVLKPPRAKLILLSFFPRGSILFVSLSLNGIRALVARLAPIASIIDLWNSNAVTRAARAQAFGHRVPSRSRARAIVTVVSCFFYCRFIISCRWSRDCELSLGAHTSHPPSLSVARAAECFISFGGAHVGLAAVRRCFGKCTRPAFPRLPSADFLTKKTNKSTLLKKIDVCRSRWMINTIMIAHAATYTTWS